jgi:hypothetical protein
MEALCSAKDRKPYVPGSTVELRVTSRPSTLVISGDDPTDK